MAEFKDELIDVKFDLKDSHAEYPLNVRTTFFYFL